MIEEFRDIPGYEGYYQVSDLGNVRSIDRTIIDTNSKRIRKFKGKELNFWFNRTGYCVVSLWANNKRKNKEIQQLVAMAFLGHKPNRFSTVVDHINGDTRDNRLINLRLLSHRENLSNIRGSSKYTGVCWDKDAKRWKASIRIRKKPKHLGNFLIEEEAAKAYQEALKALKQNKI